MNYHAGFREALSVAKLPIYWGDSPSFRVLAIATGRRVAQELGVPPGCPEAEAIALMGPAWKEFGAKYPRLMGVALIQAGLDPDFVDARTVFTYGYLQAAQRRQRTVEAGSPALGRIHAESNNRKALAYWIGFLRGVMASETVEELEVPPLVVEARNFLNLFGKDEVQFLVGDLAYLQANERQRAYELVNEIIERRAGEGLLGSPKDKVNEFYGFSAGIACDNRITVREVRKLLARITPEMSEGDGRVQALERSARLAIKDEQVTPEESLDICDWIARLVGDSATDTGLPTYGNSAVIDSASGGSKSLTIEGKLFVLTGKFEIGPRKAVAALIEERGGLWENSVRANTDYLVVAGDGSADWAFSHGGLKISRAHELRQNGKGRPEIITESVLARALGF